MAKKVNKTEEQFAQIEETLSRTEQYIEDNQNKLMKIVGAIIAVIALYIGYQNFYIAPMEEQAQAEMYMAEIYFEKDSFQLAINGDGQYFGFLDIYDDYSSSKTGQLAAYYAGISYLNLGEYDNAIEYLSDFSSDDVIFSSLALGGIGDAYMELGDSENALDYYEDAADNDDNKFTTPRYLMKQTLVHEINKDYDAAIELYNRIKKDYKTSREAQNIEKYISRAENR